MLGLCRWSWSLMLGAWEGCGDGAGGISSVPQGHRKALITSLPKHKCKLDLQHHTITQLHKSKGVVGKWTGEAAGQGREQKLKRDWDRWVRSHSSQAENWAEEKFRWNWTVLMTFRKGKGASVIRTARKGTSQLIDQTQTLEVPKHNRLLLHDSSFRRLLLLS